MRPSRESAFSCGEVRGRIAALLDRTLTARDADAVEAHTGHCAACAAELARERGYRRTLARQREAVAAPDDMRLRLSRSLRDPALGVDGSARGDSPIARGSAHR